MKTYFDVPPSRIFVAFNPPDTLIDSEVFVGENKCWARIWCHPNCATSELASTSQRWWRNTSPSFQQNNRCAALPASRSLHAVHTHNLKERPIPKQLRPFPSRPPPPILSRSITAGRHAFVLNTISHTHTHACAKKNRWTGLTHTTACKAMHYL